MVETSCGQKILVRYLSIRSSTQHPATIPNSSVGDVFHFGSWHVPNKSKGYMMSILGCIGILWIICKYCARDDKDHDNDNLLNS